MFGRLAGFIAIAFVALVAAFPARASENWAELYAKGVAVQPGVQRMPQTTPLPVPRNSVVGLVQMSAQRHGVPVALAVAVSHVESRHRCNAVGAAGEGGPLQILPATARGMGYRGPASGLRNCGVGLDLGMRHLAMAWRKCGTKAGAARVHNQGLGASCGGPSRYVGLVTAAIRRI